MKIRADQLAFEQGLAESKEQARRLIMAGQVILAPQTGQTESPPIKVAKPGHAYSAETRLALLKKTEYVSRGAYKLLTVLEYFKLDVTGYICLDAGASTGGFSDCLLQHGATKIYAVDVGKNQLHEKLRQDPRVICLEQVNLRYAPADLLPEKIDLAVADVSFISLTLILPTCVRWLKDNALLAVLIKPQFELGPGATVRGIVRKEELRQEAVRKILQFCTEELKLRCKGVVPAAIKGNKGNQEFMALFASGSN